MTRVVLAYGTRPEAIKMAPLVKMMHQHPHFDTCVLTTGQHREMLEQVHSVFGVKPDCVVDSMIPGGSLGALGARVLASTTEILQKVSADLVVVQGDTTSALMAGLAAFYAKAKVVHLEAGLRTGNLYSPFPEEGNRRLVAAIAELPLAPTASARENLRLEGVCPSRISVTGNTVIDALRLVVEEPPRLSAGGDLNVVLSGNRKIVLVTVHRRESWGEGTRRIADAVERLSVQHPQVVFVVPIHRNPVVRDILIPRLIRRPNVLLTEPLPYLDFVQVMNASRVILTDSGGVQEEAPSLGIPVLVARETTERPEAVDSGTVRLVGTDTSVIVEWVDRLLRDDLAHSAFARAVNPYGDGHASERVIAALEELVGIGRRLPDFEPGVDFRLADVV